MRTVSLMAKQIGIICLAGVLGFTIGMRTGHYERPDDSVDADSSAQVAATHAYLRAAAESDWNTFVTVSSAYTWNPHVFESRVSKFAEVAYQLSKSRQSLENVSNIRVGPLIDKEFLESAAVFLLSDSYLDLVETGNWPDWNRPPRVVLYDCDGTSYFVILVFESGGWHVVGGPLELKEKYLGYDDLYDALKADGVTE